MSFYGRKNELALLKRLRQKNSASLVVLRGRRRIGKSTLIQEYSKQFSQYIEIQGLGPSENNSLLAQLDNFSEFLSLQLNKRKEHFTNWAEAFRKLAESTQNKDCLILLDEISWMGKGDPYFAEKLKIVWDTSFKKNSKLVLVICGSVSSWIYDNIIMNKAYEGRVSLDLVLEDLKLPEINQFWLHQKHHLSSFEKMVLLSVTGGVPKYLEEVIRAESAEVNLVKMCFEKNGLLFSEFEKIFKEIFQKKSKTMEKIVRMCLLGKRPPSELAKKIRMPLNSDFSEYIRTLELAGFIAKDYSFKFDGSPMKVPYLRIKDNYLRFYLKYIEPEKIRIQKGARVISSFNDLKGYEAILGYQFENLILANKDLIIKHLNIPINSVISAASYYQTKTTKTLAACQVDLMIHTNLDVFYLCELKCRKIIDKSVIQEMQKKIKALSVPKRSALKPVLIYEGQISASDQSLIQDYFFRIIHFADLLEDKMG